MLRVLYISKVNLISYQILQSYDNSEILTNILRKLYIKIDDKVEYEREDKKIIDEEEKITYHAIYKFSSIERFEDSIIIGELRKRATLFLKDEEDDTDELIEKSTKYSETIHFYFDVYKERIIFYTKNRFGYDEFNKGITGLINKYVNLDTEEEYCFEVESIKQASNVQRVKQELNEIGIIKQLKITIKPPNPGEELLDDISENTEEYLESIKKGNITNTSILFNSTAPEGLRLNSKIINGEFEKINNIHSKLSDNTAIKNNYVVVEAESIAE